MQEYWVNVYKDNLNSIDWPTRYDAVLASLRMKFSGAGFTLYRIHVKMKPEYDGSFARYSKLIDSPNYRKQTYEEKWLSMNKEGRK